MRPVIDNVVLSSGSIYDIHEADSMPLTTETERTGKTFITDMDNGMFDF